MAHATAAPIKAAVAISIARANAITRTETHISVTAALQTVQ